MNVNINRQLNKYLILMEQGGNKMRTIVFRHRYGLGDHHVYEEEFEFEDDDTEEEITKEYIEWVFEQVGEQFTWYEKEQ